MAKDKNVTLKLTERQAFGLAAIMGSMNAKVMINNAIRRTGTEDLDNLWTEEEGKDIANLILDTVYPPVSA